jgi:hypothetical protein
MTSGILKRYAMHMKPHQAVAGIVAFLVLLAGWAWFVFVRPDSPSALTSSQPFNFESTPVTDYPAARPQTKSAPVAVGAPSPSPIALKGMSENHGSSNRSHLDVPVFLTPKLEASARQAKSFLSLMKNPANFIESRSALKTPGTLKKFLADKNAVDNYMNSDMVRVVLNSPAVAKSILASPGVVGAFLASPAMRDREAVRTLLSSRLLAKMLDCPGIQGALNDRDVIQKMVTDPQTLRWLAENPDAMKPLASAAPDLARSLGAARR